MTNHKIQLKNNHQLPNKTVWIFKIKNWSLIEFWLLLFGAFYNVLMNKHLSFNCNMSIDI